MAPPYRKFVAVGERAAVGELVEWEFAEDAHEALRDALCPGFWDASEVEKERLDAETVYGWITGSGECLVVRVSAAYAARQAAVLAALSPWAGQEAVSLRFEIVGGSEPDETADRWDGLFSSVRAGEYEWARRRPWAVSANGELLLGSGGQTHQDLARAHGLRMDSLVAIGEAFEGSVYLFRGEKRWVAVVEAALEAGAD